MSNRIEIIDGLKSSTTADIKISTKMVMDADYEFSGRELIDYQTAQELVANLPDPVVITIGSGQNIKFTRDYVFFGYDEIFGNSVDAYVLVKDLDPEDGITVVFRKSNSATVSFVREDDLITGDILQLYCYLEENPDPENPGKTLNEQYIIIHKI